ncbi:hypothetical protein G4Z16_21915 [Streptomyces bathyalis]|uniref:PPE family domain-containing protein n=1 Tax=Streptomyces bathyalis TaxID=2710756 RepID=A0A7T1T904_9ACTN|nr:hypothetical protein [Streptomyces bathyalis]QPP08616.1 hypothetical protein G4Z16_21915 [Streptomyces bathyalis]
MGEQTGLPQFTDSNMCYMGEVKTPFATGEDIDSMKAMLAEANPGLVLDVADAWQNIHDRLAGGGGSVKGDFDKAVDHILQHWEGESADEFAKKAKKISKSIGDCATYATRTSTVMRNVGHKLSEIKPKVDAIEKPGGFGSAMDKIGDGFSRDDNEWKGEIQGNQGAQKALDNHDGDLSAGKEEQLKAAAHMEALALTYTSQAKTMGTWNKRRYEDGGDYPGDPGGVAPVPVSVTPDGGGPGAAAAGASRTGSTVGKSAPKSTSPGAGTPVAGTKVDGISGGTPTATGGPGAGGATSVPGSGAPGGAGSGGMGGGVPGGPGYVGQTSGNRGVAGTGRGVGGRVPAGIGAGGAGGAGGKGAGAAVGRGPLARQRGGTLDTPQQGKGAARQGGQGLHSSRGGVMAGERGRGANGVMGGGVAGNNSRRKEGERNQGERPDYLVEDEETWMPERRDVAPPTIG